MRAMSKTDKSMPKIEQLDRSEPEGVRDLPPLTLQCFTVFECFNKVPIGTGFLRVEGNYIVGFTDFVGLETSSLR